MVSRHRPGTGWAAALVAVTWGLTWVSSAHAMSHLWRFNEFYSSADRKVQFIEMQEIGGSENETQIQNHWYATDGYNLDHSDLLGSPLPFGTANKKFLVGSESYAALPGVPAPDYTIPDGAIDPDGDTVVWWFYQTIDIPPGVMPTNGVDSITVQNPSLPSYTVGLNSPTNFAGETGTVVLPPSIPAVGSLGIALLVATILVGSVAAIWQHRRYASSSA